jgi:hypothetical protein
MTEVSQAVSYSAVIRAAGGFAIVSGILSIFGIIFLIAMFILFSTPQKALGETVGMLNDILVATQYLMAVPIAIALYRILSPYNPSLIRIATSIGIISMLVVLILQMLLVFGVLTFQQQGVWASIAIMGGVGSWLLITGFVSRSAGVFPNSVLMSAVAVPYFGFPVWAIWLGKHLLRY